MEPIPASTTIKNISTPGSKGYRLSTKHHMSITFQASLSIPVLSDQRGVYMLKEPRGILHKMSGGEMEYL
jgi:hypothetical protein